jgi:hypothetical protein
MDEVMPITLELISDSLFKEYVKLEAKDQINRLAENISRVFRYQIYFKTLKNLSMKYTSDTVNRELKQEIFD